MQRDFPQMGGKSRGLDKRTMVIQISSVSTGERLKGILKVVRGKNTELETLRFSFLVCLFVCLF